MRLDEPFRIAIFDERAGYSHCLSAARPFTTSGETPHPIQETTISKAGNNSVTADPKLFALQATAGSPLTNTLIELPAISLQDSMSEWELRKAIRFSDGGR